MKSKIRFTNFILLMLLTMNFIPIAYADSSSEQQGSNEQLANIKLRTNELEKQIRILQKQIVSLKKQQRTLFASSRTVAKVAAIKKAKTVKNEQDIVSLITIAPYFGISEESIVNIPSYNQDVKLLQQRQLLENHLLAESKNLPDTPTLEISGKIEGQANYKRNPGASNTSDIDLSGMELDLAAHFYPWLTGFAALNYENKATSSIRTNNSRLYVDRAFITLGNFNQSPIYATLGQRYVFGQYFSYMITGPMTQSVGRTRARSLLVGYQHPGDAGIYTNLYAFKGDAKLNSSNDYINQYGLTFGYDYKNNQINYDIGIDAIRNIADAQGIQDNGGSGFTGFGKKNATEILDRRVPGIDLHGRMTIDQYTFLLEYTGATSAFSRNNLNFNHHGAKPEAINFEAGYNFTAWNKPSSFAIGYGLTREALALNLPKERYITTFNMSIWKNSVASIELQHNKNYSTSDSAGGQGMLITSPSSSVSNNLLTRFGVYF